MYLMVLYINFNCIDQTRYAVLIVKSIVVTDEKIVKPCLSSDKAVYIYHTFEAFVIRLEVFIVWKEISNPS